MQIIWRTLPRLALPAALGLGLAYLGTSFLPRPEPGLRPPEELRAHGQGFGEESPVRAILERNVLRLEMPLFNPPDSPLAPPTVPKADIMALGQPEAQELASPGNAPSLASPGQSMASFAQAEPVLSPKASGSRQKVSATLSGGPSVLGLAVAPGSPQAGAAALGEAPIQSFRLVGVVAGVVGGGATGGPKPAAMLQVDGAAATLHPGDQLRGWTLVEIRPGQALLKRGQQSHWLRLSAPNAAK